jgi:probable biosynthetic protein (TIGR04098 family)
MKVTDAKPAQLDGTHSMTRRITVTPGMCSGGSLIYGQIGDWTWDAVTTACRTNVYAARNLAGQPVYLSFYFYHVRAEGAIHPHGLSFGDELDVTSRVFSVGSQSALTLHRLSFADQFPADSPLDPAEFYEAPAADCMYIANLNRWISRSQPGSNKSLIESAPPEFQHRHLTCLPSAYSPRLIAREARKEESFYPSGAPDFEPAESAYTMTYEVDVVRDINAVGLVYFASYFSIADAALHGLWRRLGRSDTDFLRRRVLEHRIGYFGNADVGTVLSIEVKLFRHSMISDYEIADMTIRERDSGELLSVVGIRTLLEEPECKIAKLVSRQFGARSWR